MIPVTIIAVPYVICNAPGLLAREDIRAARGVRKIVEIADSRCMRSSYPADTELGRSHGEYSSLKFRSGAHPLFYSYLLDRLEDVKCKEEVIKQLPQCEHAATMPCHQDPAKYICKEQCRGIMGCCGRTCKSKCNDCKILTTTLKAPNNAGRVQRTEHVRHPCERPLYCHHPCGLDCAQDHRCNPSCQGECRQQCHHQKCALPCSTPCAPCMEPCLWSCPHFSCPVACGSVSHILRSFG